MQSVLLCGNYVVVNRLSAVLKLHVAGRIFIVNVRNDLFGITFGYFFTVVDAEKFSKI